MKFSILTSHLRMETYEVEAENEEEAKSKISEENLIGSESDCFQIEEIKELKT